MKAEKTLGESRGFTLIELVIAMAVIALLAAVAYPSYTAYARRGKIAVALGELSTARVKLEQYYADNRNYGSTATTCPVPMPSAEGFGFSCSWGSTSNSQSFVITAGGVNSMAGYSYTVNQRDEHRTVQFEGAAVNAPCWLKKKGDAC